MQGTLTLHDIATIQISQPEIVQRETGDYTIQATTITDTQGAKFEIKCFMAQASISAPDSGTVDSPTSAVRIAIQQTQDRMHQLLEIIGQMPVEDRQGRYMRIGELADMVDQGLDAIETALSHY